jgi:hypothetical protein
MLRGYVPTLLVSKRLFSAGLLGVSRSLEEISNGNLRLQKALEMFNDNDIPGAISIAVDEYKTEFRSSDPEAVFVYQRSVSEMNRPAYSFLASMLASLGPRHPETISALAAMRSGCDEASPFKPRVIAKRHGGYPVRLNNGKWTWQGPHWSRSNNRTWKTGYSSDFTYGRGK